MVPKNDTPSGPSPKPNHDRYQRQLDIEKESLEFVDGLLENLLVGLEHVLHRHGSYLRPPIKKLLEEKILFMGQAVRAKRLKPNIELVNQEIELLEVQLKTGVPQEDVDSEDDLPPELPPPSPKPPAPPPKQKNGGKK